MLLESAAQEQNDLAEALLPKAEQLDAVIAALFLEVLRDQRRDEGGEIFFGLVVLVVTALALVYDNALLACGRLLFGHALYDPAAAELFKAVSQPRFVLHAAVTPFLLVSTTEIATWRRAGSEPAHHHGLWFACLAVSAGISALSLVHHFQQPYLVLCQGSEHPKAPAGSLDKHILHCSPAVLRRNPDPRSRLVATLYMALPAVFTCLFSASAGLFMTFARNTNHCQKIAGRWLVAGSLSGIFFNAGPPWISKFTGNLGEVLLLASYLLAWLKLLDM
eukprot:g15295.t1